MCVPSGAMFTHATILMHAAWNARENGRDRVNVKMAMFARGARANGRDAAREKTPAAPRHSRVQ
jgi:hypothetical protein